MSTNALYALVDWLSGKHAVPLALSIDDLRQISAQPLCSIAAKRQGLALFSLRFANGVGDGAVAKLMPSICEPPGCVISR